jgi:LPXTG-motif cell wall-anchored protein
MKNTSFVPFLRSSLAVLALLFCVSSSAFAGSVPEIDPSFSAAGLALLGGAILLIRGRRRS